MSDDSKDPRYEDVPIKKILGFSMQNIIGSILFGTWGSLQFFATSVLFIPQLVVTLMFLVYSLVDAFNDPLIGYFTDKSKRFTAKYGKRYLWIVLGGSFGPIFLILSFVQVGDASAVVLNATWLTLMMVIFETFLTLWEISHASLYPDLFREGVARRKAASYGSIFGGFFTILLAFISPILLGMFGGALSQPAYIIKNLIVIILAYLFFIPYLRSIRESKARKEFRAKLDQEGKSSSPYLEILRRVLKDKIWVGLIFSFLLWAIAGACMLYGLNYYIIYYLDLPIEYAAIPSLGYGVMIVIFTPIWISIAKKIGVRKSYIISMFLNTFIYLMFFFMRDYTGMLIGISLAGIPSAANFGVLSQLARAQAIDNSTVVSGKREEGTILGILRVFSAFAYFFQVLIFTIVGAITGFDAAQIPSIDPTVRLGLNIQMSLIPMVINLIGAFVLLLTYSITKEKAVENKAKLVEMGL
ncbi:MAG: MFS transporter [Candidatus Lokiarchaeota archaeon]|nr:MFS transporter [Candidatus Lokiarchaeota archaeon]